VKLTERSHHGNAFPLQEKVLLDPMYEAPGSDIVSIVVTQDAVAEGKPVDYIRKPRFLSSH